MRKATVWLVVTTVMLVAGVCVAQDEARRGAEALADGYEQAYNSGDMQGVADLYVDDGWLSEYGVAYQGREEILGFLQGIDPPVEGATLEITVDEALGLDSVSVDVMGEDAADVGVTEQEGLAVARGTYAVRAPDGERVSGGYWVSANQRIQGAWYLRWLITNAEPPESEGTP